VLENRAFGQIGANFLLFSVQRSIEIADWMTDADDVLRRLLSAPKIDRASLASVPTEQGVYVLWLAAEPPACLKVGIAGPRQGKGLRERLRNYFGSSPSNSVLARHLAADCTSRWCSGRDFTNRAERRAFIADGCYNL
jgi:hypothetical protein